MGGHDGRAERGETAAGSPGGDGVYRTGGWGVSPTPQLPVVSADGDGERPQDPINGERPLFRDQDVIWHIRFSMVY